jgi:hypothetical protein
MNEFPKPSIRVQDVLDAAMEAEASRQRLAKRAFDAVDAPETLNAQGRGAKGGGKLSRSETVTVRLDPKLRYLAELAARLHRRTLSSYIEWAISNATASEIVGPSLMTADPVANTIGTEAGYLWDVDEADRFAKLALRYPELLTHEEQVRWKLIRDTVTLWHEAPVGNESGELNFEKLRRNWKRVTQASLAGTPGYQLDFELE